MAKLGFVVFLCAVFIFHGLVASQKHERQDECVLDRINAIGPDDTIDCEAGVVETWNPNHDQLRCAGVALIRRTIEPRGLLLPEYSNAPRLVYIVQGKGITGNLFPGCPETFQESQESEGGSYGEQDDHQKIIRFRRGDIIALPAGVAHWVYNDGNEPVVAVTLFDTENKDNQLDNNPRLFYLAGNPEDEFPQQYETSRGDYGRRRQPYGPRTRSREQRGSCNNLFCGLDSRLLAEVFNVDEGLARRLQCENDYRGSIVRVEGELEVVQPRRSENERQYSPRRGGHYNNGVEETFCTMRIRENIADPSRADVYVPEVGRVSTVNSNNLPILRQLQMSASHVVLRSDAMRLPHWNMNAHSIMYAVEGRARVQVVNENGNTVFDGMVTEGQVLTVPQNFVVTIRAESERFEYVAFKTNDNTMTHDLAGKTSAIRGMPEEVLANAFQISVEEARRIKYERQETTLGMSRSTSSRRRWVEAAKKVLEKAENIIMS